MFLSELWMYFRNFASSKVQPAPERACRRSLGHEEGLAMASLPLRESAAEASAWSQANEDNEVVGHHRGPDIGLEVVEPAPGAAGQAVRPLEAGDTGLDAGPEVAQLAIDPAAADHVFDAEAALLVKGHVAHPACLRAIQVLAAGKTAVRRRLTRRRAVRADVALQHGPEPVTVGRVAGLDHQIEDQAAPAGGQVELVTVLDVAAALDDDVGMGLEQADQLIAGGHRFAAEHPPLALRDHPLDQWLIVADLGPPESDCRLRRPGKPRRSFAQIGQGRTGDLDQFTVERHPFRPSSRERDGLPPPLGRAAMIAPGAGDVAHPRLGLLQQADHHPYGIPQQAAVTRLVHQRCCDRAVEAHDAAVLDLLLPGARQQRPIDRLPGLGSDRANRLVQHRLLRAPRPRQAGGGPERGGVLEMEGQFLVAQLAVLLEKRTAQHRLCREALPSGLLHPVAAQVGCDQAEQGRMLIQPRRGLLQLAADLVLGEQIKYAGLDRAFLAHYRLRRWQVALASATENLPDTVGARLRKNADSTDVPKR